MIKITVLICSWLISPILGIEWPANQQTPYQVLGIPENASIADINKAHKKLALKYHPDKVAQLVNAQFTGKDINKDPEKTRYEKTLAQATAQATENIKMINNARDYLIAKKELERGQIREEAQKDLIRLKHTLDATLNYYGKGKSTGKRQPMADKRLLELCTNILRQLKNLTAIEEEDEYRIFKSAVEGIIAFFENRQLDVETINYLQEARHQLNITEIGAQTITHLTTWQDRFFPFTYISQSLRDTVITTCLQLAHAFEKNGQMGLSNDILMRLIDNVNNRWGSRFPMGADIRASWDIMILPLQLKQLHIDLSQLLA